MKNQNDKIPTKTRIGVLLFALGLFLILITDKIGHNYYLNLVSVTLFYGGLLLAIYGFTNVIVKGDKRYQKFLRKYFRYSLISFLVMLLLVILAIFTNFSAVIVIIILIIFVIYLLIDVILSWIFYIKTYKHIKKNYSKATANEKRKVKIFLIILIILAFVVYYLSKWYLSK